MYGTRSALVLLLCLNLLVPTFSVAGEPPSPLPAAPPETPRTEPEAISAERSLSEPRPAQVAADDEEVPDRRPPFERPQAKSSNAASSQGSPAESSSYRPRPDDTARTTAGPASAPRPGRRNRGQYVQIQIGQPSVWSLAQAHYFLSQMHQTNRSLATKMPTIDQLDPNKSNAGRLEILRTLLQADVGFDQSVGIKNRIELDNFREKGRRKAQAQILLQQRQETLQQLDLELVDLNQQIEVLKVQDAITDHSRGDAPVSEADRKRKEDIARLTVIRDAKKAQGDALRTEIASLTSVATSDITAPTLSPGAPPTTTSTSDPTATNGIGGAAASNALKDFVTAAAQSASAPPSLAASVALDNYVGMQYEIIAKQLTLLRDEIGPDERILFLELPASIYTVDRWADDLIAQVEWKITDIYSQRPAKSIICKVLEKEGFSSRSISDSLDFTWDELAIDERPGSCLAEAKDIYVKKIVERLRAGSKEEEDALEHLKRNPRLLFELQRYENLDKLVLQAKSIISRPSTEKFPISLEMLVNNRLSRDGDSRVENTGDHAEENRSSALGWQKARTLEIIPRQSALNINEYQATTRNFNFLGLLKLVSGFGAQVNFQKQKELYQSFLQQEVYASGFGKGTSDFGWTFGPLPGSRRIAPGQRTTYAVVAVPKKALAIELQAVGRAFPRRSMPTEENQVSAEKFLVLIPSEATENFWVEGISYTPVAKGETVTALIRGRNFSPQLGVLVNGVSLKKVLSIGRVTGGDGDDTLAGSNIQGEFELTNSHDLVLRFTMGRDFIGTPYITLVAPERTRSINDIRLPLNGSYASLNENALTEPMFIDKFSLNPKLEKISAKVVNHCLGLADAKECVLEEANTYRLTGTGFRPGADISIEEVILPAVTVTREFANRCKNGEPVSAQQDSQTYILCFPKPSTTHWKVRYRQATHQAFEQDRFEYIVPEAAFEYRIRSYRFEAEARPPKADLYLSLTLPVNIEKSISPIVCLEDLPGSCGVPERDQDDNYRVHCTLEGARGERDFVSFRTVAVLKGQKARLSCSSLPPPGHDATNSWFVDLRLPVRPRLKTMAPLSAKSAVTEQATLTGINLQRVTGVLVGGKEAEIAASGDPDYLLIKIPARDVPAGEKVSAPVIFQTAEGAIPTGFSFEYSGPPIPEKEK
jgi:hypothetical protein